MSSKNTRPLALIILDGWGVSPSSDGNAVARAHTPFYDELCKFCPSTLLAVPGLTRGTPIGGSAAAEIGHRTIGAGRPIQTDAERVSNAVSSGEILRNEVLRSAFVRAAAGGKAVHFLGLLSDGGVHSSQDSLFALLRMAKLAGVSEAYVHAILDGRDVPPRTADVYVEALEVKLADVGLGRIASLCGRFYAMDSSQHWERTARVYTMLVLGEGERSADAVAAVRASFLRGISDEFISPLVIERAGGEPVATIKDGDLVVFFNHRDEGMRQIVRSVAVPDQNSTGPRVDAVCLTEYDPAFGLPVAFGREAGSFLNDVLTAERIRNFRITETSRSEHISTFFNGNSVAEADMERHVFLGPSGHGREGIDVGPESRSFKVADTAIRGLEAAADGVFVLNFPASAVLAETGDLEKTIESVQFIDTCLGGVVAKVRSMGGVSVITASHSGCERIGVDTAVNDGPCRVPLHIVDPGSPHTRLASEGSLADVAPTILGSLGIAPPADMIGTDLRLM